MLSFCQARSFTIEGRQQDEPDPEPLSLYQEDNSAENGERIARDRHGSDAAGVENQAVVPPARVAGGEEGFEAVRADDEQQPWQD